MVKNKDIEVKIERAEFPHKTFGKREDGKVVEVKGGILGQVVKVRPTRTRKDKIKGKIIETLERSPIETEDNCIHSPYCGGCSYQNLSYDDELGYKKSLLGDLFEPLDYHGEFIVDPSPTYRGYRNKMEYTFGDEYLGSDLALGLHKKNRFHEIVNTDECNIVHEDFNIVREAVRTYFNDRGKTFYNRMRHEGFLRHFVIRRNEAGHLLLNLVTTTQDDFHPDEFVDYLLQVEIEGEIKGIFQTYNDSLSDAVIPEKLELLYGEDHIREELFGMEFKVTPFSFFQPNTKASEIIYSYAQKLAGGNKDKIIFDLYSGTGTIGQIMAKSAKKVIGIEIVEEAVESARENAKTNNLDNVEFICGDVLEKVDELKDKPDLIIIDPPRDGIHPKAINKIIDFDPEEFIYISCNPTTLKRDLEIFRDRGYKLKFLRGVDQFPRTVHVETIALIQKM